MDDICVVCQDPLLETQKLWHCPKKDHYPVHEKCMKEWFSYRRVCPICQSQVEKLEGRVEKVVSLGKAIGVLAGCTTAWWGATLLNNELFLENKGIFKITALLPGIMAIEDIVREHFPHNNLEPPYFGQGVLPMFAYITALSIAIQSIGKKEITDELLFSLSLLGIVSHFLVKKTRSAAENLVVFFLEKLYPQNQI